MVLSFNEGCTLHNSNLEQDVKLCGQIGFPYMELRVDKLKEYLQDHSVEDLRALFEANSVKPNTINGIYVYEALFSEHDDLRRQDALLEDVRLSCEIGNAIGIDSLIIVPPLNPEAENLPYGFSWEHTMQSMIRILTRLADFVWPYAMKLALEIVGSHRCAIRTIGQAQEVIAKTGKSNIGYAIDAYNLFLYEKSNAYADLRALDPKQIYIVHINNAEDLPLEAMRQAHRTFCNFSGPIDLKTFLSALQAAGYEGTVSVEVFRPDLWEKSAEHVITEAFRTTRNVLEACGVLA